MGDPAASVTLVSLDIEKPVVFPDKEAFATVTLSGPAPAGISIAVTSSNTNIITVDTPTIGADQGTQQSYLILLNPRALGTAVITATLGNSVQAEVNVQKNPKEGKEGKDGKDTAKEGKEHGKDLEMTMPHRFTPDGKLVFDSQAGSGRAFIRSEERPVLRPYVNRG